MIDLLEKAEAKLDSELDTAWLGGYDEGVREGRDEGVREGRQEVRDAVIRRAVASGLGLSDIAKITGFDLAEVQRVAAQC